jgi:hypothetical protein
VKKESSVNDETKKELISILKYLFESKISGNFKNVEEYKSKHDAACPSHCGNFHGIPSDLFDIVDGIKVKLDVTNLFDNLSNKYS